MAAESQEAEETNRVFTKEVRVVAYDSEKEYSTLRKWAEAVSGVDLTSTESKEQEWWELVYDLGRGEQTKKLQSYDVDDTRAEQVAQKLKRSGVDEVSVRKRSQRDTGYVNSQGHAARDFKNSLVDELPLEIFAGVELQKSWGWWYNEENQDFYVKLNAAEFAERRILSKESKREADDLYETVGEVPSFSLMVKMRGPSQKHIDEWTEDIVTNLVKILSANPEIGKVRFMGCEKSVTEQGECYNL